MNDVTLKKEIIASPAYYFTAQDKTLSARLDHITLTEAQVAEIKKQHTVKFIRDKTLGLFKVGEIVSSIINWNESVDEDLKAAKKEYLLAQYFEKNENNENSIAEIKAFLSSPQGNTLFNKVLRILDDTPPDIELSEHLSSVLQYIIKNDFRSLFEQHKYALAQIEKLTPQSLTILADNNSWPPMTLGISTATGSKITSDWLSEFTNAYCQFKDITDQGMITRVQHSINELISTRLIEAHKYHDESVRAVMTQVGKGLLPYINAYN